MVRQGGVTVGAGAVAEIVELGLDAGGVTLPEGVSVHAAGGAMMLAGEVWYGLGQLGIMIGICK